MFIFLKFYKLTYIQFNMNRDILQNDFDLIQMIKSSS